MAALAGCSSVGIGGSGDDGPTYDVDRLAEIARKRSLTRPDAFPVTVTDGMVARHYDRARELLEAVPTRPTVPNGAITKRLRDMHEDVATGLSDPAPDGETIRGGLDRLGHARHVRADAAELAGAYRAATGELDPEWVADRRGGLRSDLGAFEATWTYRGGDPTDALVVHAELEGYRDRVRRSAEAWPPVPEDPVSDPLRVGEIARDLEAGEAVLSDAVRLRERYLAGLDAPHPLRSAITVTAHRLHGRASLARRGLDDYLQVRIDELPVDRSLEGTPAAHFFDEPRGDVRYETQDAADARQVGNHASAALSSARRLAALRAFGSVVDDVEAGKYGTPEDVDRVAAAREQAVEAIEAAWETSPAPLSLEVTYPASDSLSWGHRMLESTDGASHDVNQALASFVWARRYARTVPDVLETVTNALAAHGTVHPQA
jgi:hypothetical protein